MTTPNPWLPTATTMVCERTGIEHLISVALPLRHASLRSMPLILCLDAPWTFGTVLDATRVMSMSGEAPEAIVVGIGFAESSMKEYSRQRARLLTPTPFEPPPEVGVRGVAADECGRADELLGFIRDQVLPSITEEHDIGERWFVGHSFSALFGLRTLFTEPELFDKWLLASPSIWWDDRSILEFEQRYADRNNDLAARVFLSAGELEDDAGFDIVTNTEALATTLRSHNYDSLRVEAMRLPGDGHSNCIGTAVSNGLRSLSF